MTARELLEKDITRLTSHYDFYAKFLLMINIHWNNPKCQSLGVNVTASGINLFVNSKFYENLKDEHRLGILMHEVDHLVRDHQSLYKQIVNTHEEPITTKGGNKVQVGFKAFNIGADREINQYLEKRTAGNLVIAEIPDLCVGLDGTEMKPVTVNNFEAMYPGAQREGTAEYYTRFIRDKVQEDASSGKLDEEFQEMDDHGMFGEGTDNEGLAREIIRKTANSAAQRAGSAPAHLKMALDKLNNSKVNWQDVLQLFIANTSKIAIESTRKKRNRRYGIVQPGYKVKRQLKLAFIVDTSGSQWGPVLNQVYPELEVIKSQGANITVIECDSTVGATYEWEGQEIEFTGGGGTMFQPALDEAAELDVDAVIYFTDGENFDGGDLNIELPTLWLLSPGGKKKDYMDLVVTIDEL